MGRRFVLDTHALIWYLEGNPRLGAHARAAMDATENEFVLPMIALAEAAYIVERGRTSIPTVQILLDRVQADPRIDLYPLSPAVLVHSFTITAILELHDRLIVGTAIYLGSLGHTVSLITRDADIARSGLVDVVW